jgi:hypothetical protein
MTQAFNLSQFANKVNTSGQADLTTAVTGTLPVANGGTGAASLTGNSVAITNAGGTALSTVAAGANGNVLTSNGSTWTSAAASGGQLQTEVFASPGTWTKPASCTRVRVTVIGGGGAGYGFPAGSAGGTSSFGPFVSATGGGFGLAPGGGANGAGTVSTGTAIKTASYFPSSSFYMFAGTSSSTAGPTPGVAWSVSGAFMAGAAGASFSPTGSPGGTGGVAIAMVPVSAPVSVTVGGGGPATGGAPARPGIGGVVLVEFVG